jgi:Protein of unknown function (DUF1214)
VKAPLQKLGCVEGHFDHCSLECFCPTRCVSVYVHGQPTIYVQNASPGPDKQENWLPAPKDNFSLYIRAYWPKEEITSGHWTPPLVKAAH